MVQVTFADLTHVGALVDANYTPLGVGYIAASAQQNFAKDIDCRLFKYPAELSSFLSESTPQIACFSNYMWNEQLQLKFARKIKDQNPEVITVFGGPNYPTEVDEQIRYLREHPEIDFYIDGEGEHAFVELFKALAGVDFGANKLTANLTEMPNVHYFYNGTFVHGQMLPRIRDLDVNLPSPYLLGLMDEFFDDKLHPLVQTSRGCPYSCTFCHDGMLYMNKTLRFSQERVREELNYIADRVKVPGMTLADLNWGIFPQDLETAHALADLQREKGWPVHISSATAKNQKERVVEMSRILGGSIHIGAAIQSTDETVLSNIKRSNIGLDAIVTMAKDSMKTNTPTFSEIILCLPGDTREKHFKSVLDMIDSGIQEIRTYQFILLPGTEAADKNSRDTYEYETRFRVLPRGFGRYQLFGDDLEVVERQEVCVANNTMTFEDYLECRDFNLSVAIFNNGSLLQEIFGLAETLKIPRSKLMARIHESALVAGGDIQQLYRDFREDEDRNFWDSIGELETFLTVHDGLNAYIEGNYGANQIYKYRSTAAFQLLEDVADVAFKALRSELLERGLLEPIIEQYLEELRDVVLARKSRLGEVDWDVTINVHFDFKSLDEHYYLLDPRDVYVPGGTSISVCHTESKRAYISNYFQQYGNTLDGLSYFIQRQPARMLYREIERALAKSQA